MIVVYNLIILFKELFSMPGSTLFDLNTPIDAFTGDKEPALNSDTLNQLIGELTEFTAQPITILKESGILYWLTYAMDYAVAQNMSDKIIELGALMEVIAKKNPEVCVEMFSKKFLSGKFKEKTATYLWFDMLYSMTFDASTPHMVNALIPSFTYLLESASAKLVPALVKKFKETPFSYEDKSALLCIILGLYTASLVVDNGGVTTAIADYLALCVKKAPGVFSPLLTEKILSGSLENKDMIYLVACALTETAKWSPDTVKAICALLAEVRDKNVASFQSSLTRVIEVGPHAGLNTLDLLLTSLVSSLYVQGNKLSVSFLVNMLASSLLISGADNKSILEALSTAQDDRKTPNGIMILVRALTVAMDRNDSVTEIINILSNLVNCDFALGDAFIQKATSNIVGFYKKSAIEQVLTLYTKTNNIDNKVQVLELITYLAASNYAPQLILSLADESRTIFINEFAKIYVLTNAEKELLSAAKQASLPASLSHFPSPRAFITHYCAPTITPTILDVRAASGGEGPSSSCSVQDKEPEEGPKEEYEPTRSFFIRP